MSEQAAVGTLVGAIMAAAVNQTIVYSIIEGNEGGEYYSELFIHFICRLSCLRCLVVTADQVVGGYLQLDDAQTLLFLLNLASGVNK